MNYSDYRDRTQNMSTQDLRAAFPNLSGLPRHAVLDEMNDRYARYVNGQRRNAEPFMPFNDWLAL